MNAGRAELMARYGIHVPIEEPATLPPPELFPKRPALAIREQDGRRIADTMLCCFPHTVRSASGKPLENAVTNVRNYTSPFWRSALVNPERRCLVPFTAFSEYGPGEPGRMPLYWFGVPSRPIVSFAGVWRPSPNGPLMAFLTCEPNPVVAPIHPKAMPVLLHEEDEARWLECGFEDAIGLAQPFPSQLMAVGEPEVSARAGSEANTPLSTLRT